MAPKASRMDEWGGGDENEGWRAKVVWIPGGGGNQSTKNGSANAMNGAEMGSANEDKEEEGGLVRDGTSLGNDTQFW